MSKGEVPGTPTLNERPVDRITAYLVERGGDENPHRLQPACVYSLGSKIYGQGFLFDDTDPEASTLAEMKLICANEPQSTERILPYIGGQELNKTPTQAADRYVIYFSDIQNEADLGKWPALAQIVRSKVKPVREKLGENANNVPLKRRWWAYQAHRPSFYHSASQLRRILAISRVTSTFAFAFLPVPMVYSEALVVFAVAEYSFFAVMQSRVHEIWARFLGSSMKDDLRYTPSDCFETFPLPLGWKANQVLEQTGKRYYEFRADLMKRTDKGLTDVYNRFHDTGETTSEIATLRQLHAEMDRAVLDAYGWTNLRPGLDFVLDYEAPDDDEIGNDGHKKPWRYRWVDEARDEVLAHLLELNRTRAEEEEQSAPATPVAIATGKRGRKPGKRAPVASPSLFEAQEPTE